MSLNFIQADELREARDSSRDEDFRLIDCYLAGDHRAFETLVRKYNARFLTFLTAKIRDPHLAEDVLQQTWFHVHKPDVLSKFKKEAAFSTWLFGVAINFMRSLFRGLGHDRRLFSRFDMLSSPNLNSDGLSVEDRIVSEEVRCAIGDVLDEVLSTFSPSVRERNRILWKLYSDGMPNQEIALVLGMEENTVKSAVFNIKSRMTDRLSLSPDLYRAD